MTTKLSDCFVCLCQLFKELLVVGCFVFQTGLKGLSLGLLSDDHTFKLKYCALCLLESLLCRLEILLENYESLSQHRLLQISLALQTL